MDRPLSAAADGWRPATVDHIREIARSLPGVSLAEGGPTVYQVSRRSFLFFRNPRPDAVDPDTGERYTDVIVFWVDSELEKEAILADVSLPFFTTPHFDGHPSVLVRGSRIGELSRDELAGFVEGAWLSRAGPRAVAKWMKQRGTSDEADHG
ncbi:MAG: hypothetical protein DLM71_02345 [Chloroflexi bacterium]|nr:MAG: hypothetical protein DLM71_02345 [Chloroflexota bacterium]